MSYEQKNMSGSLFRNTRKEKDTHPDYAGSCVIEGRHYWINAWTKEANGKKFFSFAFKPKEQGARKPEAKSEAAPAGDDNSECPF